MARSSIIQPLFRRGCGSLERWQCSHWNARALPFKKALGSRWKNNTNGLFIFLHILCQDGKLRAFQDLRGQLLDFQKTKNVGQGILKKLYWKLMTQCKNPVVAVAHVMPISALHNLCSTHRGSQVQNLVCLLCVQRTGGWRGFQVSLGSAWARYEDYVWSESSVCAKNNQNSVGDAACMGKT